MDTYLVAYDISDAKRLRKVASTCEDFGYRRQFSVFICRLTALDLVRLRSRLYDLIDLGADQVIFVPLCARCSEQIEALQLPTGSRIALDSDGHEVILFPTDWAADYFMQTNPKVALAKLPPARPLGPA